MGPIRGLESPDARPRPFHVDGAVLFCRHSSRSSRADSRRPASKRYFHVPLRIAASFGGRARRAGAADLRRKGARRELSDDRLDDLRGGRQLAGDVRRDRSPPQLASLSTPIWLVYNDSGSACVGYQDLVTPRRSAAALYWDTNAKRAHVVHHRRAGAGHVRHHGQLARAVPADERAGRRLRPVPRAGAADRLRRARDPVETQQSISTEAAYYIWGFGAVGANTRWRPGTCRRTSSRAARARSSPSSSASRPGSRRPASRSRIRGGRRRGAGEPTQVEDELARP